MNLTTAILLFIALTVVVATGGTILTRNGDKLADQTGIGEALIGGILLGAITSLSGVITSITAAYEGLAQLSFSNAVGGIAAQSIFLAVADITYRRSNLEHAAASLPNMMQMVLLILMLISVILSMVAPEFSIYAIHPISIFLFVVYILGNKLVNRVRKAPMWIPAQTRQTVKDEPEVKNVQKGNLSLTIFKFVISAVVVGFAGYWIAQSAMVITEETALSGSFVGALFTSVSTSLPELVVSVAAVRQGALTLAVANVIGGNSFDVLFLTFSDIAYREGSIYHNVGNSEIFLLALTIFISTIMMMGMLHRQRLGIIKSGWESIAILAAFLAGYVLLYFM